VGGTVGHVVGVYAGSYAFADGQPQHNGMYADGHILTMVCPRKPPSMPTYMVMARFRRRLF
jgi:hypothetical protein